MRPDYPSGHLGEELREAVEAMAARYPQRRSALLPALWAIQRKRGCLPALEMAELGAMLHMTEAEVTGAASFYTLFTVAEQPRGRHLLSVCGTLSCALSGAHGLLHELTHSLGVGLGETTPDGLFTVVEGECLAACDRGPVLQVDQHYHDRVTPERLLAILAGLRASKPLAFDDQIWPPHAEGEARVLFENIEVPGIDRLETYRQHGGYRAWAKALAGSPAAVTAEVKKAGLRGRGGAGFPTGGKWDFIPAADHRPRYLICNADESEPGTFKDRELIHRHPHLVVEGVALAAFAIGAQSAFIYCRGEFAFGAEQLERAVAEAETAGLLGGDCLGSGIELRIIVHRGAGAYICGEETAQIESLEGRRGTPRVRPPFPAQAGLYGMPTIVNNVETLANLPYMIDRGAEAWRGLGTEKSPGTKLFSVSGAVERPGNYEVPMGTTLGRLLELAGGVPAGRRIKAVIPGGSSTPLLANGDGSLLEVSLDFEGLLAAGSMLGSGGVMVLDDSTCVVDVVRNLVAFYQRESCGKCVPCRVGSQRHLELYDRLATGRGVASEMSWLEPLGEVLAKASLCPLGQSIPAPVLSSLRLFPGEYEEHLQGRCPAGVCAMKA